MGTAGRNGGFTVGRRRSEKRIREKREERERIYSCGREKAFQQALQSGSRSVSSTPAKGPDPGREAGERGRFENRTVRESETEKIPSCITPIFRRAGTEDSTVRTGDEKRRAIRRERRRERIRPREGEELSGTEVRAGSRGVSSTPAKGPVRGREAGERGRSENRLAEASEGTGFPFRRALDRAEGARRNGDAGASDFEARRRRR